MTAAPCEYPPGTNLGIGAGVGDVLDELAGVVGAVGRAKEVPCRGVVDRVDRDELALDEGPQRVDERLTNPPDAVPLTGAAGERHLGGARKILLREPVLLSGDFRGRGEHFKDPVCGDRAQPAARRESPGRCPAPHRPRGDPAPHNCGDPGPAGPPQRQPVRHLHAHWPWATTWLHLWHHTIGHSPPAAA
jgi:hypothetical protein